MEHGGLGELRNSAKKMIGVTSPNKELSMLDPKMNMSRDILNTGEKQIMAAYNEEPEQEPISSSIRN
jgi:hypothetical protein